MPSTWQFVALGTALLLVLGVLVALGSTGVRRIPGSPAAAPASAPASKPAPPTVQLHVSPTGADTATGAADAPLRTIQAALERAEPGTVINLAPGVYREQPVTVRDGSADAPIVIQGPEGGRDRAGRYRATVYGTGRIVSINHSHHVLDGFTVDGQERLADVPFPTDLRAIDAFKDGVQSRVADGRLIYVGAADTSRDITGVRISNMFLNGAGGECVRLRNNAHGNAVTDSVIQYCGMFGKGDDEERATYHNGEGVYIGTSPNSEKQPMHRNDGSSNNLVSGNIIRTFGSECFNVKENAHDNVFADNVCSGNTESAEFDGSNVELRGHRNVVRNNQISDSAGYTLKIKSDDEEYDKGGNVVTNNHLSGAAVALMLESDAAQGPMCGNVVATRSSTPGRTEDDEDGDEDEPSTDLSVPC
ncbi:MAG TPA: DUF1565 domain-containing protein [Actinophytocola sp.]|nr:DUF1565 domain-containing protein [Actinophytocola sp.]